MRVFLKSVSELNSNYHPLENANKLDDVTYENRLYMHYGDYSIETRGIEKFLLVIKAISKIIFSFGFAYRSPDVQENLQGRRIDIVYINVEGGSRSLKIKESYFPKIDEDLYAFRKAIFNETLIACENGYINSKMNVVMIDNDPMLKGTETYNQLETLAPINTPYQTKFSVIAEDTFKVMLKRVAEGLYPVGINMANLYHPGGGADSGCPAQEEALCRSSNHILGLKTQSYPIPVQGGIYCPHVKVIRKGIDEGFAFFDKPLEVALVAVAAFDLRENSSDRQSLALPLQGKLDIIDLVLHNRFMRETTAKIANMLREMAIKGHQHIVLGALGCGAFQNPPTLIARIFGELFNGEFKGRFAGVDFAILNIFPNDHKNIEAFTNECEELNKNSKTQNLFI
ncbi:MAG: TIGR02452 family protein [Parachlamydiaceae bacterium]|nr:TIGR02452 family protein [Parachlamydiaceae bacterium]